VGEKRAGVAGVYNKVLGAMLGQDKGAKKIGHGSWESRGRGRGRPPNDSFQSSGWGLTGDTTRAFHFEGAVCLRTCLERKPPLQEKGCEEGDQGNLTGAEPKKIIA